MKEIPPVRFEFTAPPRIVFGWGRRSEVGALAAALGRRAFLVSGSRALEENGTLAAIEGRLRDAGLIAARLASVRGEPEIDDVESAVAALRSQDAGRPGDLVVAVGGGSAIDLAKAAAALATNRHGNRVVDFLEGVGTGCKIEVAPLPVLALPTTSGTGSEATRNAVISSTNPPFKKSLRSEMMVPRIVLVDPELTVTLPPSVTAQTGMDAITQLIESFISRRSQPIPRALALDGLKRALPAIETAVKEGTNRAARESMAYAALLSGLALANSGLGMAHGVAAALGIHCGLPHGLACAVMLPAALRANRDVCRDDLARLWSLVESAKVVPPDVGSAFFVAHIESLIQRIGIPSRLSAVGVRPDQIEAIVAGSRGNSMDANPRAIGDDELRALLEAMV